MKVELRDGSFDYAQLEHLAQAIAERASSAVDVPGRAQLVPRRRAPAQRRRSTGSSRRRSACRSATRSTRSAPIVGSSYVGQFNKFGRVFQIYVQAEAAARLQPESLKTLMVRNTAGGMVPLGTLADITTVSGSLADLALQPLSGGNRRRQHRARLQLRSGPRPARADRQRDAAARLPATNGRRCPTRRRRSAIRSISSTR